MLELVHLFNNACRLLNLLSVEILMISDCWVSRKSFLVARCLDMIRILRNKKYLGLLRYLYMLIFQNANYFNCKLKESKQNGLYGNHCYIQLLLKNLELVCLLKTHIHTECYLWKWLLTSFHTATRGEQ